MSNQNSTQQKRSQLKRAMISTSNHLAWSQRKKTLATLAAVLTSTVVIGGASMLIAGQPILLPPIMTLAPPATNPDALPTTPYQVNPFEQSVRQSLQQLGKSAPTLGPLATSNEATSNENVPKQNATRDRTAATPPVTAFNRQAFDETVAQSLSALKQSDSRSITPSANAPTPTTKFDRQEFDGSISESLSELQKSTADSGLTSSPMTRFDRQIFDSSIAESLSELQRASDQTAALSAPAIAAPESPPKPSRLPPVTLKQNTTQSALAATTLPSVKPEPSLPIATPDFTSRPNGQIDLGAMRELPPDADSSLTSTPAPGIAPAPATAPAYTNSITSAITQNVNPEDAFCETPGYHRGDFSPTPIDAASTYHDAQREAWVYDSKEDVPTQRPWIEWPRKWYGDGITPEGINLIGEKNLVRPKLYLYGDYRTGIIAGRNAAGRTDNWAHRLNLDLDFQMTDTGRFHTFFGPLDEANQFTRFELANGEIDYREAIDFTPVTGFFEGDLGVILGTAQGKTSPFELPFTVGLIPLLFQNGVWMEDAITGAAFALPARHSRLLNISNMDITFFAGVDQLNSPAFVGDNNQVFGTAAFIEAYGGYIETGYAYLNDRGDSSKDYHNATVSYTRRYFDRISNSVRVIVNAGQEGPKEQRTADGALLLVESSWITASPLTFVPYANFFAGWDRPQSVARAGISGGILRNTGLNFDTDGVNGFASLDATGSDTAGGAIGVDLIGDDLDKQLIIEAAYQTPHGSANRNLPDDQFAVGSRFQFNLSNATLLRFDVMHGWRRGLDDVYGTRMEYRWKF